MCCCVHSGSRVFIWAASGRRLNSGSNGFTRAYLNVVRFRVGSTNYHRVHSRSREFTRAHLGVAGFIRLHVGSP